MHTLRSELARDLPTQLVLMATDGLPFATELRARILDGLPDPASLTPEAVRQCLRTYAFGPRPYDLVAVAAERFIEETGSAGPGASLIEDRVLRRQGWHTLAENAKTTVPSAMRQLRQAFRARLES